MFKLPPKTSSIPIFILLLLQAKHALAISTTPPETQALKLKVIAIASILASSALGICTPILLKTYRSRRATSSSRDEDGQGHVFFLFKAFGAGVILATGFIHILPDAFASLSSPLLSGTAPWGDVFSFAGLISMSAALATFLLESFATAYRRRLEMAKALPLDEGDCDAGDHDQVARIVHRSSDSSDRVRHRLISQVLELGILVHSVIIGIALGASQSTKTIKPLVAALSFHQFFEGMGLGACISQAEFNARDTTIMVLFFSLTTPTSIAVGIGILRGYREDSTNALILQGTLNAASAGILIYMALVDLLATDLSNPKLQNNLKVLVGANFSLLLGTCCMALLAKLGGT